MRLEAQNVCFRYARKAPPVLNAVSFSIAEGERVALLSPSGFGKTTFVKLLAGYERPTAGQILLDEKPLPNKGINPVQLIFQHPESAINPRWRMRKVLEEAGQLKDEVLQAMGIEEHWLTRYSRELSGGELQRFCVARALCGQTRFLITDEMSTMLDAVTQAQIWQYILSEAQNRNLGLIAVTHNLALAERVCKRVVDLRDINRVEPLEA